MRYKTFSLTLGSLVVKEVCIIEEKLWIFDRSCLLLALSLLVIDMRLVLASYNGYGWERWH